MIFLNVYRPNKQLTTDIKFPINFQKNIILNEKSCGEFESTTFRLNGAAIDFSLNENGLANK